MAPRRRECEGDPMLKSWRSSDTRTRTKTKYRDLSTTQRTIRPSVASVEMTFVWVGRDDVCFGLGWGEQATRAIHQTLREEDAEPLDVSWGFERTCCDSTVVAAVSAPGA